MWARLSNLDSTEEDRAEADEWRQHRSTAIVAAVRGAVNAGEPDMAGQPAAALAQYLGTRRYPGDLAAAEVARPAVDPA